RSEVEPCSTSAYRLHLTVSPAFLEKLEKAKDALGHKHPGADLEAILMEGLDLVLAKADQRRAQVERSRQPRVDAALKSTEPTAASRYVPANVRRAVWKRDGQKCQWPIANGGVCGATRRLELDHIRP